MLKFYFATIVIWMIITECVIVITKPMIIKNGWAYEGKSKKNLIKSLLYSFCFSAIPVLRFCVVLMFVVMSGVTKEKYDAWIEENKSK